MTVPAASAAGQNSAYRPPSLANLPERPVTCLARLPALGSGIFEGATDEEPDVIRCTNCGTVSRSERVYCPWCGEPLAKTGEPAPALEQVVHEGANHESRGVIACPTCGNPTEPGLDFCTTCGTFMGWGAASDLPVPLGLVATLTYTTGSEWSPTDPFGRCVLVIGADGAARLDKTHRGQTSAWRGRVPPAILGEVLLELFRAGFPHVPDSLIPPDSSPHDIQLRSGTTQTARIHGYLYRQLPGYREAIPLLDAIVRQLSLETIRVGQPPGRTLVTDVKAVG